MTRIPAADLRKDPVTGLWRAPFARLPTPLEPAPRLAEKLGLESLVVKREDLAGDELVGNKASSQPNFCRTLAGAWARAGLACHLLLRSACGPSNS